MKVSRGSTREGTTMGNNAKMYFIEQELASYVSGYRDDYDLDAMFDAMKDEGLVVWDGDNYEFADGADFDIVDYLQRFDVSGKE